MTMFSSIMDGVLFVDRAGVVTLLNAAGEELTGLRAFAVVGHSIGDLVGQGELIDAVAADHESVSTGEPCSRVIEVHEDDLVYIKATSDPIRDAHGRFAGVLTVLEDVTDEHKTDQLKNQYLSIVAHELRTPLTGIKTFSTMMAKGSLGELSETQQRAADSIREQSLRLEHQIDKLINIGYIDSANYGQDLAEFDLAEFIAQSVGPFARVAEEQGVEFAVDADVSGMVRADRSDLRRALQALIENAVKFCPSGASVRVSAEASGDGKAVLRVSDTGIGIDPRYQRRIFEKFFQVEDPLTRHHGGAGLGLFVAQGIVEAHGSSISVRSTLGEGAEFAFEMPMETGAEPAELVASDGCTNPSEQ